MKKTILLAILIGLFSLSLFAQGWEFEKQASITLSQSTYSDNWAGDEMSNVSWMGSLNMSLNRQYNEWMIHNNSLKMAFGQTHKQEIDANGDKRWQAPTISTDKIDAESLLRITLQSFVDPYAAARFQSKFLDQAQKAQNNTRIINPMLFSESIGAIRTFIDQENTKLNGRLGATFRQNVNRSQITDVTDPNLPKETLTVYDGGLELISEFKQNFSAPLASNFASKLEVYQALVNSESGDDDKWKAPVMSWENTLTTKLFGIVSANFLFELRYNKQQVDELQWKQMLGLGVIF